MVRPYSVVVSPAEDFTRCILCGCPTATGTPFPVWLDVVRVRKPSSAPSIDRLLMQTVYARRGRVKISDIFTKHNGSTLNVRSDRSIDWRQTDTHQPSRYDNNPRYPGGSYFILHEQCWQYAWGYFGRINVETLYDVLRSVPPPRGEAIQR